MRKVDISKFIKYSKKKQLKKNSEVTDDYKLLKNASLFDSKWYLEHYIDVKNSNMDPIIHYLKYGWKENRNPGPLFVSKLYLEMNPDIKKAQINPLLHYLRHGKKEGRNIGYSLSEYKAILKSGYFNKKWYNAHYKEVKEQNIDPIIHYLTYGWMNNYNPSKKFNTNFYLTSYPDIKIAKICPLLHYIQHGKKEGRVISRYTTNEEANIRRVTFFSTLMRYVYRLIYNQSIKRNKSAKIAVHIHLFYEDIWFEIKNYLKNLECYKYDLFITSPQQLSKDIIQDIKTYKPKVRIFITENRGFDLGPFIYFLHKINLKNYNIIFKLHTKRDVSAGNYYGTYMKGSEWRTLLYEAILSEKNVHKVIDELLSENKIGLFSHSNLISSNDAIYNKEETIRVMNDYELDIPQNYEFIIGTMFAGRAKLFQNIKEKIRISDFSFSKRNEFTLAHCFERILCLNVLSQGYSIKGTHSFHWSNFIRKIQSKLHTYNPVFFYNSEMIKNYDFYQKNNTQERKQIIISSLLKEKDKRIYNALIHKAKIDIKKDEFISKTSFEYHFFLKELIEDRVVAKIISPCEITRFKLIGSSIVVEKESKQKGLKIIKVCNQYPQFVSQGTYLLETLEKNLCSKNISALIKELFPYFSSVFNQFKTQNRSKLTSNAWDAIPRNTLINKNGEYCFFDCNIKYLLGVSKSYFIYRVVIDLLSYAKEKDVLYSASEEIQIYNKLCHELNICGDIEKARKLENYLQMYLYGRISKFNYIKDLLNCLFVNSILYRFYNHKKEKLCIVDDNYKLTKTTKYFNKKWYLHQYPDVVKSNMDPLYYWLYKGWKQNQDPSKHFSVEYYLTRYPDIKNAKVNPLIHYIKNGKKEGRLCNIKDDYLAIKNSKLFNKEWYSATYNIPKSVDLYKHYLTVGYLKGYNPSSLFDTNKYLLVYPDVLKSGMCPLAHWELKGKKETTRTFFSPTSKPEYLYPVNYPKQNDKKKILLVSHILNHTGAPILLVQVAKMFKNMDYEVVVMSPKKGDLIDEFLKENVPVIINENCIVPDFDIELPYKFEFCICNTILLWATYTSLAKKIPTIWWIHDNILPIQVHDLMKKALNNAKNIYVPSDLTKSYIDPYNNNVKKLSYPIKDDVLNVLKSFTEEKPIKIAVYATLQARKGQDLFVNAIKSLPKELRKQCIFELVGEEAQPNFKRDYLEPVTKNIKEINYVDIIKDRDAYHTSLDNVDILCCPSREDPYPLVVIDALMHGCPVIISDHVGEKDIIVEMENGLVFESGNVKQLSDCLAKVIINKKDLLFMSNKARETFLKNFDYLECSKKFTKVMEDVCKKL